MRRPLQPPHQRHRQHQNHYIGEGIQRREDRREHIQVYTVAGDFGVPVGVNGHALEDCAEDLSDAVAEDEGRDEPEGDGEGPRYEEDSVVEV